MTMRLKWEWEPASDVRLPEFAATWCRLNIELNGTPATLVERRDGSGGLRHGIDVAAYPLAEFLAVNWWRLNATSHSPADRGVSLIGAGEGFAWPDLTLRNDRGLVWASLRQRDKAPEHVRFLTQTETVLDAESALSSAAEFIDDTVRRLQDAGIGRSLLQDEWAAIQQADSDERDYCLVAAAWGQDPYDTPSDVERLLHRADAEIGSATLLADLSRAVPLDRVESSVQWLKEAMESLRPQTVSFPWTGPLDWRTAAGLQPWTIGYEGARTFRRLLDLAPSASLSVEELLTVRQTNSPAPTNVDGLIDAEGSSRLAVVVGATVGSKAKRFAAARAIGRQAFSPTQGLSLLTRGVRYTERTERAFAAELLAPAIGIEDVLGGDFSDEGILRAAKHFNVNPTLIQHQVENQIAA